MITRQTIPVFLENIRALSLNLQPLVAFTTRAEPPNGSVILMMALIVPKAHLMVDVF